MPKFTLRSYLPLPNPMPAVFNIENYALDSVDVNPDITSMGTSNQVNVGYSALQVGFLAEAPDGHKTAWLETPIRVRAFGHTELRCGLNTMFEGEVVLPGMIGGYLRSVTAKGYGVVGVKSSTLPTFTQKSVTGGQALAIALLSCPGAITPAPPMNFVDPGGIVELTQFSGQSPSQVIDQITRMGGTVNVQMDFAITRGRKATLKPRTLPAQPNYLVPLDGTVDWQPNVENCYGQIVLNYTSLDSGTTKQIIRTDPTFGLRFNGLFRSLPVEGGTMSDTFANQFAATWLQYYAYPVPTARITRKQGRGLELYVGGADYPPYLVQPGQWVQCGNQKPLPIVNVNTQYHTRETTFDLNEPLPGTDALLSELRRVESHVKRGTNANTGAANVTVN